MSLAASMLDDDALRAGDDGFELDVHLNWYRSLPLSSVHTVDLTVNGETIPREEITFSLHGNDYSLDELGEHWDEMWFVLDPATLRVRRPLVRSGDEADVRIRLGNRIPYILIGPDRALEYVTERSKSLVAR
ncbi:MAG TPA: DUF6379 domain-containing protein [Gaiella sp.]|jgi:hypothetical protein|nr:DUF6379 domain-containing protein [Gaiella sp.]